MEKRTIVMTMVCLIVCLSAGSGNGIEMLPTDYKPIGIGCDPQGNVVVSSVARSLKLRADVNADAGEYFVDDSEGKHITFVHHFNDDPRIPVQARVSKVDAGGNVYIAGTAAVGEDTNDDFALVKYNEQGQHQWSAYYDGPAHLSDMIDAIAFDANGNVYVAGASGNPQTYPDIVTIKYGSGGSREWISRYDNASTGGASVGDYPLKITVDGLGNVYVLGASDLYNYVVDNVHYDTQVGYIRKYFVIKYSPDGVEEWQQWFPGDQAIAIATDSANNLFVAGTTDLDVILVRFDANGNGESHSVKRYETIGYAEMARDMIIDGNDNIHIAGIAYRGGTNYDCLVITYDRNGSLLGDPVKYDSGVGRYDSPRQLALSSSGSLYVSGSSYGEKNYDIATACIGGSSARYDSKDHMPEAPSTALKNDILHDLVKVTSVDSAGNIIVYGVTVLADRHQNGTEPATYTYRFSEVVVKYSASMSELWSVRVAEVLEGY
ncbi:MAG TPA: hypothetical protein PLG17_08210 [Thermodesulfobacteriota bacterium]|nr:hypothetical protein [Deltaproteobacteria bacterium]HNR12370.1 hypothetical protein [Thermodesulfobacteriota bacterium]HOC38527.1 hypothetical protein [Thermodesulfobacteriota bacterium]HQO78482.1 hypothetical protein [Thermodesulfobacteriota bacterium]